MKFYGCALLLCALVASALAASGDFTGFDFAAAAPLQYNHQTGGGAWNNGDIGRTLDVVESLQGGDFECGDVATHFVRISMENTVVDPVQDVELFFHFTADSTGQSGVGYTSVLAAELNLGLVENGDNGNSPGGGVGVFGFDSGFKGSKGQNVTIIETGMTKPAFTSGSVSFIRLRVHNLRAADVVILRLDLRISCLPFSTPTGNLQASLMSAVAKIPGKADQAIGSGAQTVPLKGVGDIPNGECEEVQSPIVGNAFTANLTVTNPDGTQTVANNFAYSWALGSYKVFNSILGTTQLSTFDTRCTVEHAGAYTYAKSKCGCEAIKVMNEQPQLFFETASTAYKPGVAVVLDGLNMIRHDATVTNTHTSKLYLYAAAPNAPYRVEFKDGSIWQFSNVQFTTLTASDFATPAQLCTCRRRNDIVLMLETSATTTVEGVESERTFARNLTRQFDIGPDHAQFAVYRYGTTASQVLSINNGNLAANVLNAIGSIKCSANANSKPCNSDTDGNVYDALTKAMAELASSSRGFATKSIIFVTDGWSNTAAQIAPLVQQAKDQFGIHIFVVSYATIMDEFSLRTLATSPDYLFPFWTGNLLSRMDPIAISSRICLLTSKPCGESCCGICDPVCQFCADAQGCQQPDNCMTSNIVVGTCCVTKEEPDCKDDLSSCKVGVCDATTLECVLESTCNPDPADNCYDYTCKNGACVKTLKPSPAPNLCQKATCVNNQIVLEDKTCPSTSCSVGSCDVSTGKCTSTPIPDPSPTTDPCTIRQCDPATGWKSIAIPDCGTTCEPACTSSDLCQLSFCRSKDLTCVTSARNCSSNDRCTLASCDSATGLCKFVPRDCDDGNACTEDSCDPLTGECRHVELSCESADKCFVGSCNPETGTCQTVPKSCDDGIACTIDSCDPSTGCSNVPNNAICMDGDPCHTGVCSPTNDCVYTESPCPEGENGCQIKECIPFRGCNLKAQICNLTDENTCNLAYCDENSGNCTIQENTCDNPYIITWASATVGVAAIIGIIIAAVVVVAVTGGGVAAAMTSFGTAEGAVVLNNPLYAGARRGGDNPLHKADK